MAPLVEQRLNVAPNTTIPITIQAEIRLKVESHDSPRPTKADPFLESDRALLADGEKKDLLSVAARSDLTESIGTVLSGTQLTTLSQQQLDELALLVSERGVVFLRQQDFHPDDQVRALQRLGELHKGSTTRHDSAPARLTLEQQDQWHSDASFERNPPSYSLLNVEDTPEFGGDAAWVSQYGLYDELSAHMKGFLQGLHAVHSSQDGSSPVISHHPAVRTHPVTGLKALNVTPGFVTGFAELKKKESDNLLGYLSNQIDSEIQHIVRWKWEPGCAVIWDNRCTAYRAIPSTYAGRRTSARTAIVGEKPYLNPESESRAERAQRYAKQEEDERERLAIQKRYNNTPLRRILAQQVLGMRRRFLSPPS
ncbi:alpha-ketoglutarate-dependent sulfonate dioxygenase [Lentithecium fluviatile CBS 122367]|uniref:Alpha-ketoglutarate-dependent sulfonate dioxygenase n=1 Tax=Lentithecium fluviatile CBS 122367 TaxID=1168545 RepID=A0A6G1IM24_9PLEO|nr:alpha-ketoglutarate-dependent sulfonate dioxygenase [Lentithecium fluviatile CBS 122367]